MRTAMSSSATTGLRMRWIKRLMLRGSRDFATRAAYEEFLTKLFSQLNSGRTERFRQEVKVLKALPPTRMDSCTKLVVRVGPSSTIRVKHQSILGTQPSGG